jgi:hypothetical protein
MAVTPVDLYAFGPRSGPRPPRPGIDLEVDAAGLLVPQTPPLPLGASTVADPMKAPLRRHYHRLPQGTVLPEGLDVIADGRDADANSPHGETHHTIYPTAAMTPEQFIALWNGLPWQYAGTKP